MVPLAWALRASGHDVRMASQPELVPTMRASGLPFTAVGRDVDVTAPPSRPPERTSGAGSRGPGADEAAAGLIGPGVGPAADEARSMFRAIWASRTLARPSGLALYGQVAAAMVD